MASYVKVYTPADRPLPVICWYGFDWSSEAAFYSERRSSPCPTDWLELDVLENPGRFLRSALMGHRALPHAAARRRACPRHRRLQARTAVAADCAASTCSDPTPVGRTGADPPSGPALILLSTGRLGAA